MKILITGGAGFIGSNIVNLLNGSSDNDITVIDSLTEQIHGNDTQNSYLYQSIKGKCNFIKGDIRDYDMIADLVANNEYIIHLAAETGTGQSMYKINQYNDVNIMGTSNLFQAILSKKAKIKKVILGSSRAVYGEGKYECPEHGIAYPQGRLLSDMKKGDFHMHCPVCGNIMSVVPTDENSKLFPESLYAFTKLAQENMVKLMCKSMGIDYTIFRFQNVYGVGQSLKNPYTGILSIFSGLLLEGKALNIFEDGKETRDFINVLDISRAVIQSLNRSKSNGEIINLGSGIGTSVIEIASILKKYYNSSSEIKITGDFRVGDIAHNIADTTKAKEILEFQPEISLEEGLKNFADWVLKTEYDNTMYENSLTELERAGMFIRNN
ncbi:NAD-dependent epimerase/dehydratase family protein [Hungatella hathewayi]|uniref:NAD-dependent epimerase/dehydratase family protein n=1 Tax=Hungatella hathewayi TaxID=154046 RepID=UPI00356835DC